jgi:hypothetical protein
LVEDMGLAIQLKRQAVGFASVADTSIEPQAKEHDIHM